MTTPSPTSQGRDPAGSLSASSDPDKSLVWAVAATAFFDIFCLGELLAESAAHFNMDADLAWGDVAVNQTPHDPTSPTEIKKKTINLVQAWTLSWVSWECLSAQSQTSCIIMQSGEPRQAHSFQLKQSGTVQTPIHNTYTFNPTTTGPFAIRLCRS